MTPERLQVYDPDATIKHLGKDGFRVSPIGNGIYEFNGGGTLHPDTNNKGNWTLVFGPDNGIYDYFVSAGYVKDSRDINPNRVQSSEESPMTVEGFGDLMKGLLKY